MRRIAIAAIVLVGALAIAVMLAMDFGYMGAPFTVVITHHDRR